MAVMEVLLVYGENKRELLLPQGSDALQAIREEFQKLLPISSISKGEELMLQRFSKKWDTYIDITSASEICNGDKVTICQKKPMKASEVTLKGKALCSKMEKPCEADSRRLRSLFPSSSVSKRANSKAFNPLDDCVVAKEKRQKKGVRLKPRKITVVLITDKASTKVPRGLKRKDLLQRGYIKQIEFLRNMSAQEVRNKIIGGFPDKIGKKSKIAMLMADPKFHVLTKVDEREGGADAADVFELAGQGSLYVRITNEDNEDDSALVAEDETCEVEITKVDTRKRDFSDDDDLIVVDFKKPKKSEEYDEWHMIRKEQNEAFAESLRIDQEKDRQAAALKKKKEACEHLKETILCLLSKKVHTEDSIKLGIRMTNGTLLNALFHPQDSAKLVYQYVFANTDIGNHFKLCTADVPRQDIFVDDKILSHYGITSPVLLIVEMTEESYFNEEEWITEITELESTVDSKSIERVLRNEEESRIKFMKSVSPLTAVISPHTINRITLFEDLLKLYDTDSDIVKEYPLQMDYFGENAVDLGGVSRDVMSAFWELAYEKLFDGSKLLVPVISPHVDLSSLPTIGKILSHGYLCTGFLPIQISFPSLAAMLLGPNVDVESRVLLESLLDYVSDVDRSVLHGAVQIAAHTSKSTFPPDVQEQLLTVLSNYGCRQLPSPSNLSQLLTNIARFIFLTTPMSASSMIYAGIPSQHQDFWQAKSPSDLHQLYKTLNATPIKVLSLLEDPVCMNKAQRLVFNYLRQYIGNMTLEEVRFFLRFVTGSSVCSATKIEIQFNMLSGLARRPISHTCSNLLELSATYLSYPEFVKDFKHVLSDNTYTWIMDSL